MDVDPAFVIAKKAILFLNDINIVIAG